MKIREDETLKFRMNSNWPTEKIKEDLIKQGLIKNYEPRPGYHVVLKPLKDAKLTGEKEMKNLNWKLIKIISLPVLLIFASCASSPDWKENHYQNANAGHQCQVMCITGQQMAANEAGCSCEQYKRGNQQTTSTANGNYNVININGSQGYGGQQPNYGSIAGTLRALYEDTRADRIHSDKVHNGHYSTPQVQQPVQQQRRPAGINYKSPWAK